MKVAIVSEFYPRAHDPVLGVWAHEQAKAARDAGADVRVLVLHRPIPPLDTPRRALARETRRLLAQPLRARLDGIDVTYVPFVAPPRPGHYGAWGAWAAPSLAVALRALRRRFAYDLVHAHNAVPAGEAVRRARIAVPLVVSVHGPDVLYTPARHPAGDRAVRATLGAARLVLANSEPMAAGARELGAREARVVHLGTDLPMAPAPTREPLITSVGHLVARKRHADVLRALWVLRDRHPDVRYLVVGDGPEREPLLALAARLGLAERVELAGQLDHAHALERTRVAHVFALPSVDEAFGVAYVEAMAAGIPAVGCLGEPGPQEIAAAGDGIALVPPGDPEALAATLDELLSDATARRTLGARARATVQASFTWERCGIETVAAYRDALVV